MAQSRMYVPRDTHYSGRRKPAGRKRRRNKRRLLVIVASLIIVLGLAATIAYLVTYKDVHHQYSIELGEPLPPASEFAKNDSVTVEYITDISEVDPAKVGSNWLHVSVNGEDRLVNLVIEDTIPPKAEPVELVISPAEKVSPTDLVSGLADAGLVKVQWDYEPKFGTVGDYPLVMSVRDLGGNVTKVESMLLIRIVVDSLTVEAGASLPVIGDFLTDKAMDAKFLSDISSVPVGMPGTYEVSIEAGGNVYASSIVVKDTKAPDVVTKTFFVQPGGQARPEDFVESASDATAVTYSFAAEPDYNMTGHQDVSIIATDAGGNSVQKTAVLLISEVAPITVDIRNTPLTVEEFRVTGYGSVTLNTSLVPDTVGEYDVELMLDGQPCMTRVKVTDLTPPKAEAVSIEGFTGHPLTPEDLVKNVFDYSEVTYAFGNEPDWSNTGVQNISVKLTDASGNWSEYTSTLTLEKDTEPPALYGVKDRFCYVGEAIAYFEEVFAQDNCDAEVKVEVDNSEVNINAAGAYRVKYTAVDSSGNKTEQACKFTFIKETITDEQLKEKAQEVLGRIIKDGMSMGEKLEAVFDYVQERIKYTNSSDKTNWKAEAYRGFTTGRGDCFTYFSLAKCLLQEMGGVETMDVERYGGKPTRHYWLLVNIGSGWYHYDTIDVAPGNYRCFMKTDDELLSFNSYFYSWKRNLYPPSAKERFKMD